MREESNNSWLKAAVIGSIWASFEIIFGTFLHNLRIPFAGTFLTFFSLVLLIGFSYKWNDRYLFLKAGIITALMRSMLPTSIILGPLIGILVEAVIFQISVSIFKRTYLAFVIAGILSMFSAILHKVVSILIIYGFDIVKVLENMYFVLLKTTHIDLPLKYLFLLVTVVYTVLGIITAYIGVKTGKQIANRNNISIDKEVYIELEKENKLFNTTSFKYNSILIFIHIIALILSLILLENYSYLYSLVLVIPYLIFIIFRYGNSLRRLSKPVFWIQLLIILLFAILFWNNKTEGFIIGMKMLTRAIMMISVFTTISVELKNPVVKALMYQKGFSGLYTTIGLASSALPFLLKNIVSNRKSFTNPIKVLKKAIELSDSLLHYFTGHIAMKNKLTIISGETRSGKTTYLKNLIQQLSEKEPDLKIGGLIAHGIDKNGERLGFELENILTGQKILLCNNIYQKGDLKIGKYYFKQSGLEFGQQSLKDAIEKANLLIIDEIGPMELKGKGWFNEIESALKKDDLDMIWVVRKSLLDKVLKLWQHSNVEVINISKNYK